MTVLSRVVDDQAVWAPIHRIVGTLHEALPCSRPMTTGGLRPLVSGVKVVSVPIKKLSPHAKGQARYRCVVDVGAHPSTGKRRQVTRTFGTLRETKAEYAHITYPRYEAAALPFDVRTLDEWLDEWLVKKAEDMEESAVYSYSMTLARLRGLLGHIRLQGLAEDDVEASPSRRDFPRTLMGHKVVVEKDTKSSAGERQLPLPDLVCDALAAFSATQIAEKLAGGGEVRGQGIRACGRPWQGTQWAAVA
ncbi:hypothetical protein [Streptomyces sp. C3-3]|uniref:hypothetical protein n=1 Tax=Streptomyces sp. C3-3 TaxID=2824901 RepID=UPI001B380433|nr:hypothetical protein [Streptomyces sp. C3-3]MBQ1116536.1 hypothetical protein [Streptomyces sp. C3-3]